jgi:hypothetical protein
VSIADEARAEAESWLKRLDGDSHWARSPEQRERIDHERGILRALLNDPASRKPEAAPSAWAALTAIRDAYDRTMDMRPACDDDFYAAVQEALNRVCDSDGNFIATEAAPSDARTIATTKKEGHPYGVWRTPVPQAAPSDTDNDRIARIMARVTPLGYASALALVKAETKMLEQANIARVTSQPVQVEVTDMDYLFNDPNPQRVRVEVTDDNKRLAADLRTFAGRLGTSWGQDVLLRAAAALGGGE